MKPMFSLLSPAGARARLSTLIFHRVLPVADPLFPGEVHAQQFDQICSWLKHWFNVLPLDEAVERLVNASLPARALAITFDDGYADNYEVALPILRRHSLQATFFVATGFLDDGCMWNDQIVETIRRSRSSVLDLTGLGLPGIEFLDLKDIEQRRSAIETLIGAIKYLPVPTRLKLCEELSVRAKVEIPADLMMSSGQVVALRQSGMQIGAHTVTHPILATLDPIEAKTEVAQSKRELERLLSEEVCLFAYPNGQPGSDYKPADVDMVRSLGFKAAVSTTWGAARQDTDLFQIPRFTPWDRTRIRFGARMMHNLWAR